MDKAFKIAVILSAYDKLSTVVNSAVDKSTGKLNKFQHNMKHFAEKAERGMIIGEGGMQFFEKTVDAAEQSEVALKRLEQVFKNRGVQGEEEAKVAEKYAKTLSSQIGIQHEEIELAQAKLGINKSIGAQSDLMNRATVTAFNIAATGFGEASMNAGKLGKMLEHPVEGINAFAKANIIFSKGEKEKIKLLTELGHKEKAQDFILAKLEDKFKNVAKNIAPESTKAKIRLHELQVEIGEKLLPTVNKIAVFVTEKLIPAISSFIEKNPTLVRVLAAVSVALVAVGSAARVLSFILETNPIVLVIAAIAAAVFLIYKNWDGIKQWFSNLWNSICSAFSTAWEWIKNMFLNYTPYGLIIKHWAFISTFFSYIWRAVKIVFKATWEWVKNLFLKYTPAGLIIKHWDKISGFFSDLWDKVTSIFSSVWDGIKGLFLKYSPAGIIYSHWDEIVTYFTKIWDKVKNVFSNAWKSIKSGLKSFFGAGGDIDNALSKYETKVGINNTVAGAGGGLRPVPVSNSNQMHYNPVIQISGTATPQDAQNIANSLRPDFAKQMKQYQANQQRVGFQ